ncbi:hypothetical protein GGR52DRAFT_576129 [Hypoxylon sp. FL1284]|nr:hypothetical protein GGR52DRAFT_576129 [Hypoxylon sp. FL1284]
MSMAESMDSPTIKISEPEKDVAAPPPAAINYRKTLPPLPLSPLPETSQPSWRDADTEELKDAASTAETLNSLLSSLQVAADEEEEENRPPRPISKDVTRPDTAATKTTGTTATGISYASAGSQRTIKYGTGRHANVELSPQPSEDPADPLNWPLWKKHLNLGGLLLMAALVGAMKTAYVSVNSAVAVDGDVSYSAVVALTGVPLMLAAATGMASLIVARIWGKRPVYLVSTALVLVGMAWNAHVRGKLAENMAARVFQGLGWGAFDTLVLGSIQDTYFEHERESKIIMYSTISVGTMLGAPLLGGLASSGPRGFELQFDIMSAFLSVAVVLLLFGAPETAYDRQVFSDVPLPPLERSQALWPNITFTKEAAVEYLWTMKPWSYRAPEISAPLILQAPRATLAPTTALLFAVTMLPYAGLWGLASSLALLFSPLPSALGPSDLGALMTGPFVLGTPVAVGLALPLVARRFASKAVHLGTLAAGTVLAAIGILGFGLYVAGAMQMPASTTDNDDGNSNNNNSQLTWDMRSDRLSLPVASLLLGLLAAGSLALDATAAPLVRRSAAFTSASLAAGLRNAADMQGGLACLRGLAAGALVLGLPDAIFAWQGLRAAALGIGIAQVGVVVLAAAVYWRWGQAVRRLDGTVMGLVDLSMVKKTASFFDESD